MNTNLLQSEMLPLSKVVTNIGQIEGVPKNPRVKKDIKYEKLLNSIKENPEMLAYRELLVYKNKQSYVTIGGNMRLMALKELGYEEAPCKILPPETTTEQLKAYIIKDNVGYGDWDWSALEIEWDKIQLEDWGVDTFMIAETTDELEEPTELEDNKEDKPYSVKITFLNEEQLNTFRFKYEEELKNEFDGLTLSVSGGKL